MTTLPNYPAAVSPLDGSEFLAIWQNGKQCAATTDQVLAPGLALMQQYVGADLQLSWAALSAVTGSAGRVAVIPSQSGTHEDPVTHATVPNTGFYSWIDASAAWQWISDTQAGLAAAFVDKAQAWAEGTLPGGAGTKSSKEWADVAAANAGGISTTSGLNRWRDAFFRAAFDAYPAGPASGAWAIIDSKNRFAGNNTALTWDTTASPFGNAAPKQATGTGGNDTMVARVYATEALVRVGESATINMGVVAGAGITPALRVTHYDAAGTLLGTEADVIGAASTSYQVLTKTFTVPANWSYSQVMTWRSVGSGALTLCALALFRGLLSRPMAEDVASRYLVDKNAALLSTVSTLATANANTLTLLAPLFEPKKNIFDAVNGTYQASSQYSGTGVLQTSTPTFDDRRAYLNYIPVDPNTSYVCNSASAITVVWYDSAKAIIGGASYTMYNTMPRVSPSNAAFMRFSHYFASTPAATLQIEKGTAPTAYEAYTPVLKASAFPAFGTSNFADKSVTPAKTSFMVAGKNLFDANGAYLASSQFSGTGAVQTATPAFDASRVYTAYMPVEPNTAYISNLSTAVTIVWYDANYAVIGPAAYTMWNATSRTSPANAAYMRVALGWQAIDVTTLMIEKGSRVTYYEPYRLANKDQPPRAQIAASLGWAANALAMPAKVRFLKNEQNTIYFRAIQRRYVRDLFFTRAQSSVGASGASVGGAILLNRQRYARLTPTAAASVSLRMALYDGDFDELDRKTFTIDVVDPATNPGAFVWTQIGDSFTYEGHYLQWAISKLTGVTTQGIRNVVPVASLASAPASVNHEGRSGWSLANYFGYIHSPAGFSAFSPFMHPVAPYKYFGCTRFWRSALGGAPTADTTGFTAIGAWKGFTAATGFPSAPAVNDVIYDYDNAAYKAWDGSAWQTITEAALGFTFNFAKYLSTWGLATPNGVGVLLGTNDFGSQEPRNVAAVWATFKANLDIAIASIQAAGVTKICLLLPASVYGLADNTEGLVFPARSNASMWEARNRYIAAYDAREAEGIYLCDFGSAIDDEYGFSSGAAEKPFAEYTGSVTLPMAFNLPHPNRDGYYQGGVRLAATIQAMR